MPEGPSSRFFNSETSRLELEVYCVKSRTVRVPCLVGRVSSNDPTRVWDESKLVPALLFCGFTEESRNGQNSGGHRPVMKDVQSLSDVGQAFKGRNDYVGFV